MNRSNNLFKNAPVDNDAGTRFDVDAGITEPLEPSRLPTNKRKGAPWTARSKPKVLKSTSAEKGDVVSRIARKLMRVSCLTRSLSTASKALDR
jgi:hypothetical protein